MEFQKITNLLDITSDYKDLPNMLLKSGWKYTINQKKIAALIKKLELKHQCLDQIYAILVIYIVAKGDITLEGNHNANKHNKNLTFKYNAPFISCISEINGIKIDNAEHLDVAMPMYNLLECSKNYRKTTGSLWNCYRDQPSDPLSTNFESFKNKYCRKNTKR